MRITIHAVGRMKSGPETDLVTRYLDRASKAGRHLGISAFSIREIGESRRASSDARKDEEAVALIAAIGPTASVVALDEHGEDIPSAAFSALLRSTLDAGFPELCLLVGGPDGHGAASLARASRALRFGKMTWPHQLVRIMLAEQVYRAITILSGHPYHRE